MCQIYWRLVLIYEIGHRFWLQHHCHVQLRSLILGYLLLVGCLFLNSFHNILKNNSTHTHITYLYGWCCLSGSSFLYPLSYYIFLQTPRSHSFYMVIFPISSTFSSVPSFQKIHSNTFFGHIVSLNLSMCSNYINFFLSATSRMLFSMLYVA